MHTMTPFNPYSGPVVHTWMVWPNGVAVKLDAGLPHGVAGDDTWKLVTASTEAEALTLAAERRKENKT